MDSEKEKKSRQRVEELVRQEITTMFETILDYTQVACPTQDTFKVLRSRILRVGNDCIRNLCTELRNYNVKYEGKSDDIIEVIRKK